jgi:signal transduction histidine kinase/ActR/RegA family two-component response regulator
VLRSGAGSVIVAEEAVLAEPGELVACMADQPVWSDLPIIVLSRAGREAVALGDVVWRLGNVSVVERPMRMSSLLSLTRSSLRARERQYQVREHVAQLERAQTAIRESIEAERAARAEAERAGRTKDEFLATLSHELRTPLNAILGWTQVMRGSRDLNPDALRAVTVIERNARAQAQIIEDLLDMSSIISGKVRLDVQRVDLAAVINATVETIRPAAEAKRIRLALNLQQPAAALVRGDPHRLQQVLWNLLTNAVKFTGNDGHISIVLARVGAHAQIDVSDDGEGIDPKFLPHVFDRFRQADPSSARRHGGLGLGLSIVKQLVELHGGTITATSAGHDRGATFRITLPLMAADDARQPASQQNPRRSAAQTTVLEDLPAIDLGGCRILVVDDEPDARSLIQRLLQDCNATVTAAASAKEAIEVLHRGAQDVLVSDIGMPAEDGYCLIRRVRASHAEHSQIPAVALTAYARAEDGVRAVQAGFQVHLPKPVEPIKLIRTVQRLAQERRATVTNP